MCDIDIEPYLPPFHLSHFQAMITNGMTPVTSEESPRLISHHLGSTLCSHHGKMSCNEAKRRKVDGRALNPYRTQRAHIMARSNPHNHFTMLHHRIIY